MGGFATPVFRRASILWEVISARPRSGVRASRNPVDTYSVPSRHESITSQSAMQACAISLLSRNCPLSSLVVPRCTERSVLLQWAMNRLGSLDHYGRPQSAGNPQDIRRSSFGTLRVDAVRQFNAELLFDVALAYERQQQVEQWLEEPSRTLRDSLMSELGYVPK